MQEITKEQIAEWKKKHGSVYEICVEDKIGYIRKPDRKVLGAAMSFAQSNPLKMGETILASCWLGGDDELRTDDDYFLGVNSKLEAIIEVKEAEIKKL